MWIPPTKENAPKGLNRQLEIPTEPSRAKAKKTEESKNVKTKTRKSEDMSREDGKGEEKSHKRRKFSCPVFTCRANVTHLPRHMCTVHHWTREAARKVLSKFNIRKRKNVSTVKKKDYHSRRRCPLPDCHAVVQRLPAHLTKVHNLDKSSADYTNALTNAPFASDVRHDTIHWQEERFKTKEWEGGPESRPEVSDNLIFDPPSSDDSETDSSDGRVEDVPSASTMPALLRDFEDWFRSPDGGKRDDKTVKQHSAQLFSMLKAIDDDENPKSLLDVKLVRHVFLKSHVEEKNYEAGTIKSYLMSLRHFYTYLISDRPNNFNFDIAEVSSAREKVKLWSGSYKRQSSERKWQKLEEDMVNRLTPANIRSFEKSQTSREAVKIIGEHSDTSRTTVVSQQSYTLVRDFSLHANIHREC